MIRGDRVQTQRKALRLTQIDLAAAVRISQGFLSQIEAGRRDVSTSTLVDLARTLHTTVGYLLGLEQSEDEETERVPAMAS
jgi:transcriptional regulator with XRE-family HTH domain